MLNQGSPEAMRLIDRKAVSSWRTLVAVRFMMRFFWTMLEAGVRSMLGDGDLSETVADAVATCGPATTNRIFRPHRL